MRLRNFTVTSAAALSLASPAAAQLDKSVLGANVQVAVANAPKIKGELIAVSTDSVWVLRGLELLTAPVARVSLVRLRRHKLDGAAGLIWTVVGGVVTAGLLTAACNSVDGAECGGLFAGVMVPWAVIGGLSALSLEASSRQDFRPGEYAGLRAYARFPQGLPEHYDAGTLALPVPASASRRQQR